MDVFLNVRAELSQQKVECMKLKYSQMADKVEQTRTTLRTAQDRIDRQNQIHDTIRTLQDKADQYADKITRKKISSN